jgi:glycosyltransferase involved in cell wall biosynthesis
MQNLPSLKKDFVVYIPLYNCEKFVLKVIDDIPANIWKIADILIVDNQSTDGSLEKILKANNENRWPKKIHIVQTFENKGYAGSQKLAYKIVVNTSNVKAIAMLHGDGQYDSSLLNLFVPHLSSDEDIIYGHRTKMRYGFIKEETPLITWAVIKALSIFENFVTGYWRKEWHSGFVMYKVKFLSEINIDSLTDTMHIDGHLHYVAGMLQKKVKGVPIYKRYKNYTQLKGATRVKYVLHVLKLIFKFKSIDVLKNAKEDNRRISSFNVICE